MSTQFYIITDSEGDNRTKENCIGVALNAGYWCWTCGEKVTISPTGALGMCSGRHSYNSSHGEHSEKPKEIARAYVFTWRQQPYFVETLCRSNLDVPIIIDELTRPFTGREFLNYLSRNFIVYYMHDLENINL